MTDLITTEPGPAAPFGLLNELLSLRAELAEAKESLRLSAQGLHTYVEALNAGNAALAAKDARIAELEAAGNRLGDAAITGILDGNDFRARAERAEAELDISREALRMVQSALLSQAAETERAEEQAHYANGVADLAMKHRDIAEAKRDALREALQKIEQETIDHVAVRIARAARDHYLAGENS